MGFLPPVQLRRFIPSSLLSNLLLALLLACLLALLRVLGPQESLKAPRVAGPLDSSKTTRPAVTPPPPEPVRAPTSSAVAAANPQRFVLAGDTINGEPLTDNVIVERIERIAAAVPADLLEGVSREPHVRYLSQAFGAGDDAPVYYGMFREPAAALAFGCALDETLAGSCEPAPVAVGAIAYEDPPGVHCRPLRLALGAPVYEPDRCEAGS